MSRTIKRIRASMKKELTWKDKLYNYLWLENPIVDWFLGKIVYPIQNFKDWVIKVGCYAKFLWSDRDWDWVYILELLKFKLQRTEKCIRTNGIIEGIPRVSKQINYAIFLIDRNCN